MAERVGGAPEWIPVTGLATADVDRAEVERVAAQAGQPPLRWPDPFPFEARTAALAATFAKGTGRAVAFSLAAMRQAFLAGRDLSVIDNVLLAAAACELHPRALLTAIETAGVADALEAAIARAQAAGVSELPAIVAGDRTWSGKDALGVDL
jgi:2-hydroxychromene-2-carboxylate isomerase